MTSNKPNLFLITLACVFFVIILYLLSLISIKNNNQINTPSLSPAPTILPTPQVKLIDTSDWKIYKNDTWNFSVKYPANWKVYSYGKPVIYLLPEESVEPAEGSVSVSLVLNVAEPRIPTSWTDYKLIDSKIYDGATWAARNNLNDQIYFWKNKIEVDGQITKSPLVTKEIFETILSTFKFTGDLNSSEKSQGTITGALCYPSSFIPAGKIIAKNITTKETFSQEYLGSSKDSSIKFSFDVPEGTYHLKFTSENGTSGYYNSCAKTMAATECDVDSNHKNLDIVIKSGQVLKDINPCDFYYSDSQKTIVESTY